MGAVDWVVLAIVGVSALLGAMRGLVGMVASLVAWVLAGWVAFRYGGGIGGLFAGADAPSAGNVFAGYALSFLAVMVVVSLVGWIVRKLVDSAGLSGVDRLMGFGIGVARGAFVACALVLLLGLTSLPREPEWRASKVIPVFVPGAQWMRGWLPPWVAEQVDLDGDVAHPGTDGDVDAPLPAPVAA